MSVLVQQHQLSALFGALSKHLPASLKVLGEVKHKLDMKHELGGYDVTVDKWPDFSIVIWKPNEENTRIKFREDQCAFFCTDQFLLKRMFIDEQVFNWGRRYRFSAIDEKFHDILREATNKKDGDLNINPSCNIWSTDKASLKVIPVPAELSLNPLEKEHASVVARHWDYSSEGVDEYIMALIQHNSSLGLFNSDGNLVGFALETTNAVMGMLHVLNEFRGKGYSKILVSSLAQKFLETEEKAFAFIHPTNDASVGLHRGLGFKMEEGNYSWIQWNPS